MPDETNESFKSAPRRGEKFFLVVSLLYGGVLFVVLCLVLARWKATSSTVPNTPSSTPTAAPSEWTEAFSSQTAFVTYCILLAGVLGAAIRVVSNRISINERSSTRESTVGREAVQLFLGAATAFTSAFLVPFALAQQPLEIAYNVWGLIILGGLTGYASKGMLGTLHEKLEVMTESLRQGLSEIVDQQGISKSIREGVEQALTPPQRVNYDGELIVDILRNGESILGFWQPSADTASTLEITGPDLRLELGSSLLIRVATSPLGAERNSLSSRALRLQLRVDHGVKAARVPFHLVIDAGFFETPLQERDLEVPSDGVSPIAEFPITLPARTSADEDEIITRNLKVLIYQHGVPYGTVRFPIVLVSA
jgi:hypothetical protein